jgi:hypothetical protein
MGGSHRGPGDNEPGTGGEPELGRQEPSPVGEQPLPGGGEHVPDTCEPEQQRRADRDQPAGKMAARGAVTDPLQAIPGRLDLIPRSAQRAAEDLSIVAV